MPMPSKLPSVIRPPSSHIPFDYGHPFGYRFGTLEVDFHVGELRKSGMRIRIQDQPLQVLWILLRQPGEIVTREEFRSLLWPADTFVDFDHGLNSAVKRLRDALDDDPENPRLIETIPRHGYRFIAPVSEIAAGHAGSRDGVFPEACAGVEHPSSTQEARAATAGVDSKSGFDSGSNASPRSRSRIWAFALTAACLLIGGFFAGVYDRPARARPVSPPPPVTLVVLPFRDLSAAPSHGLIAEGMTQILITHLGKLDPAQVVVSAQASVDPYKSGKKPAAISGSEAGVEYVLNGSTQLQGSHLRISVQMMKTGDQTYVWAESYDDTADDLLRAQADIAAQITTAIRQKLTR
jgi:TolB-like protein/DNA-binding winged helix-turn-helix (wHTH) protein